MVTALQGSQPQVASNRNTEVQGVWNTERGDCKNDEGRDLSRTVGGIRGVRPGALARRGELLLGGRGHRWAIHHRGGAGGAWQGPRTDPDRPRVGHWFGEGGGRAPRARAGAAVGASVSPPD